MHNLALFVALVQGAYAVHLVERAAFSAAEFAGATTSAVFPVPNATNAAPEFDSFFPDASAVGFEGPTPTGDEAELVATATSFPKVVDAPPLVNPSTFDDDNSAKPFDVIHSFGNLAPMFSVDSFGLADNASMLVPEGCEMTQVHLLHRHGARYPTSGSLPANFAAKLHNATLAGTGFTATGNLSFLNTWSYKLGAEILTPFGRQQLYDLGVSFRVKYGELLKDFTGLPVFRTTSEDRMLKSALNFAAGFFGIPDYLTNYRQLITVENDGFNNTLAVNCANQGKPDIGGLGTRMANAWRDVYLKEALERLGPQLQGEGVELDVSDLVSMQELCAYETVALGTSAFCNLFTVEEWRGFEYFLDLAFWYGNGPGNPTSAAVGIGYVQELIARLTQTPITVHNSSTNSTITDSGVTFPLDQPVYVDATHDTDISAILVALNFTSINANGPLPTDHIPENQTYFVNQIAPFGAHLVAQVLSCPSPSPSSHSSSKSRSNSNSNSNSKPEQQNQKHIRFLLNDAPLPLTGISGCPSPPQSINITEPQSKSGVGVGLGSLGSLGLCPLDTFISAMRTRIGEVDFGFDCSGDYTVPNPDLIVDGRPPLDQRPPLPSRRTRKCWRWRGKVLEIGILDFGLWTYILYMYSTYMYTVLFKSV